MWLLWVSFLFVPSLAFPFGNPPHHYHGLLELGEWPILNGFQRPSFCLPSPFFGRLCLPSISRLLSPMRTLQVQKQGCVSIPLTPEYDVKLCPSKETIQQGENLKEPQKEIIKERDEQEEEKKGKEEEPEVFSDNAIVQVNGKEHEAEKFVEKEGKDKSESQFEQDDNDNHDDDDMINKIIQVSEEIIRFDNENNSPEPTPMVLDDGDETVSIMSNLV